MNEREAFSKRKRALRLLKGFRSRGADFRLSCCDLYIVGNKDKLSQGLVNEINARKNDILFALLLESGNAQNFTGRCRALTEQPHDAEPLLFCECKSRFVSREEAESWTLNQQKPNASS